MFFGAWSESNRFIIKMEYCETDLGKQMIDRNKIFRRQDECSVLSVLRDIGHALAFLHAKNIVHLDVKPGRPRLTR